MVVRELLKGGVRVLPIATRSGLELLGGQTLAGLTGERTHDRMWDHPGEKHVELGASADVLAIVPATADVLARMAQGRADDLVTATYLCARGPVVVAPAMHPRMWEHPATQRNVAMLAHDGRVRFVGPVHGEVASGDVGVGRLAEPEDIAAAILAELGPKDLAGLRLVVTAGPTVEDMDPVRFLGNRSTGKMGFAIARRAALRGAEVTLVTGPVALPTPWAVRRVDVRGALDMQAALNDLLGASLSGADGLVMTAAVADYRPKEVLAHKRKRDHQPITIELVPNPDLLAEIGLARLAQSARRPVLVGFAVETADDDGLVVAARKKLENKSVDLVVANRAEESFGREDNRVALVTRDTAPFVGPAPKLAIADRILDEVRRLAAQ
ncbi:MAG: bifunctional phosphopantothenoylcysteine decarboxylase/phosphopantothenate--cysteine ligase CoaBC [Myxococcales bacterium]|nr:bifunctional phosphopantothenoylcysteine decarboxylase/phosphopantothenate--cysteine ligase CoaBC [Myxococcales bacterium]